jgi:hypothetical protein
LFLLAFLSYFYIRTALFPSVVNSFDPVRSISTCLADNVRNIDQVCRAVPVKARTRFIVHFDHKERQTYRVMRQSSSGKVDDMY